MEQTAICPSCDRKVSASDAYCGGCGTSVNAGLRTSPDATKRSSAKGQAGSNPDLITCGSCHIPIPLGDAFCSSCGAPAADDVAQESAPGSRESVLLELKRSTTGRYEILRELGHGGMGIVYAARDLALERMVAIKILSPSLLANETMVERFKREAKTVASLRHELIVSVHGVGEAGDLHYFVMDFSEGASLGKILRSHGALPIPIVRAVLYQVGSALAYAHRPGREVVHRDVKPSNILIDLEGQAIVMDFGIAKVNTASSGLTRTGSVFGTPEYMSPEQCRGHKVTKASDQYSLGAVAYAMLTGAPPFTGPFYRVLLAHQTDPRPSPMDTRPDCPPELAKAVERMLAPSPTERWSDIEDALTSLDLSPLRSGDPVRKQIGTLVMAIGSDAQQDEPEREATTGDSSAPTTVTIGLPTEDIELGNRLALSANIIPADGIERAGGQVSWESSDPAIALVDPSTGEMLATGVGSAEIRAWTGDAEASVAVRVRSRAIASIAIAPESLALRTGEDKALRTTLSDRRGESVEAEVLWASSDPTIAAVTDEGRVHGNQAGSATIHAHAEGVGAAAFVEVTGASSSVFSSDPAGTPRGVPVPASTGSRARWLVPLGIAAAAALLAVVWIALPEGTSPVLETLSEESPLTDVGGTGGAEGVAAIIRIYGIG